MQQFGQREAHQRTTRSWAFESAGPCFDVQSVVTRCEKHCEGEARDAAGGTGGDRAHPDGNHGDNLSEGQR